HWNYFFVNLVVAGLAFEACLVYWRMGRPGTFEIRARRCELRIDPKSCLKFGDGLCHVTLPGKSAAKIIMGNGVVRLKLQQFTKKLDSVRQLSRVSRRFSQHAENSA